MVSDLLSGVLQTQQALQEKTQICYLGKMTLQWFGGNNCGQHELEKAFISQCETPPPTFQLFYFSDRLEFCDFF